MLSEVSAFFSIKTYIAILVNEYNSIEVLKIIGETMFTIFPNIFLTDIYFFLLSLFVTSIYISSWAHQYSISENAYIIAIKM